MAVRRRGVHRTVVALGLLLFPLLVGLGVATERATMRAAELEHGQRTIDVLSRHLEREGDLPPAAAVDTVASARTRQGRVLEATTDALRVLAETDAALAARFDVSGVAPRTWTDPRYLAAAEDWPRVASYWERYREYSRRARVRLPAAFEATLRQRLLQRGLAGDWAADAMTTVTSAVRDGERSVFEARDSLAAAARAVHDLARRHQGALTYRPAYDDVQVPVAVGLRLRAALERADAMATLAEARQARRYARLREASREILDDGR